MKHLLFLLFVFNHCIAQDSTIVRSKYEDFSSKTGVSLKTEQFEVSSTKDYTIVVGKIIDLNNNISIKSLQLYQKYYLFMGPMVKSTALYIDWEEAPDFINALKHHSTFLDQKPSNDVSYSYITNGGVKLITSYIKSGPGAGWSVYFARVYKYLKTEVYGSSVEIKKKDLSDVIALLEKAVATTY